jgi:hypothetical protein
LAGQVQVLEGKGTADLGHLAVALGVGNDGGAQEFTPVRRGNGERALSARALATKAFRSGGRGKANRVSRCARPQAGQTEQAQSGTVKASSASAACSAYRAKKALDEAVDRDGPAASHGSEAS